MRVLCTVGSAPSHVRAMLPVVRALGNAGHEVLVVTLDVLVGMFDGEPVRATGGLTDIAENLVRLAGEHRTLAPDIAPDAFRTAVSLSLMNGPHITENYGPLLAVAQDFKPDLVVRDGYEPTACLVAETLGVPHLPVPSGSAQVLDPVAVSALLNQRREEVGLPADDDPLAIYRYGRLDCMPARYSFARYRIPPAFAYRQPPTVDLGETLPEWLADLPVDRPLVMAAIGGSAALAVAFYGNKIRDSHPAMATFDPPRALHAIIAGLSQVDCVAVVSTGGIPVDRTTAGPNVRVVDSFPQPMLLECADLFVTHGGYNSIREAVRAGVPMAVLPLFDDQFPNADRVEALGLGARVAHADPAPVADTCRRVLKDEAVAAEARRAQRHVLTLPLVDAAVAHLEEVVERSRG